MAKTNPIHAEITIGEYIAYVEKTPLREFPSDDKGKKAKEGMNKLKLIIEKGPSDDPLVLEAFNKIEGGLDLDTPFNRLNSQDQSIMEYIYEQRKLEKGVPLLSNEKAYSPKRLKAIFGDRTPSPEELNVRYIPHDAKTQSALSGGTGAAYSPIALKSDYDNFRVAIDIFKDESKKKIPHGGSVPDYLVDNRFQLAQLETNVSRFGSWGLQSAQHTTAPTAIVSNVRMVDYMRTIQNAIEMIDETSDEIKASSELSDLGKENLLRLHRETKNAIKLKLATSVRNTDLFGISSIAKEGIYLNAESMKLIGASQKTGGGQILPLSNLGRMAVTEQIAEQRNQEILRIASQENISINDAYARFVDNVETGYYDKVELKLFTSSKKDITDLAKAYLTRAAKDYDTGRVNPVTSQKITGLGLEKYVKETGKYVVDNTLTLSDLRKSLASIIGGDVTLGSKAQRKTLAQTLLGHATDKDVASTSYIRAFMDDPASDEFLKAQLQLEQRWAEATDKGTVHTLLEDSSTKGIPGFEPTFEANFAKFAFITIDEAGKLVDVTTPDELLESVGKVLGLPAPRKITSLDVQVGKLISPERQEAWTKFADEIKKLSEIEGSVYQNTTPEMRNGHVSALVDFFTREGENVEEGIELLKDVHSRGEDITNIGGSQITLEGAFSDRDVLWHTLHEAGSDKHSIEQLLTDKGLIERRDKPVKPKRITVREQKALTRDIYDKMLSLKDKAENILSASKKYDVDELIDSELGLDVAAKIDETFADELAEVRADPNYSQEAFESFYDSYNENIRKQGFNALTRKRLAEWVKGPGKVILRKAGVVWKPALIGAAALGVITPLAELQAASSKLYGPERTTGLSLGELGSELPDRIQKAQTLLQSETAIAAKGILPKVAGGVGALLTPQDHEDVYNLVMEPNEFDQKVIEYEKNNGAGLLADMQKEIQQLKTTKMDKLRNEGFSRRAMIDESVKDYSENTKLYEDYGKIFNENAIELKAVEEANKWDLNPVLTRHQREVRNSFVDKKEEDKRTETVYEIDAFTDMPQSGGFVDLSP